MHWQPMAQKAVVVCAMQGFLALMVIYTFCAMVCTLWSWFKGPTAAAKTPSRMLVSTAQIALRHDNSQAQSDTLPLIRTPSLKAHRHVKMLVMGTRHCITLSQNDSQAQSDALPLIEALSLKAHTYTHAVNQPTPADLPCAAVVVLDSVTSVIISTCTGSLAGSRPTTVVSHAQLYNINRDQHHQSRVCR